MHVWMYFALTTAVVLLAGLFSHSPTLARLGVVLAFTWGITRVADENLGHVGASNILLLTDGGFGVYVGFLVWRYRSIIASVVFGLFLAMCAVHAVAFGLALKGMPVHMHLLNILYALQQAAVFGGSAYALICLRLGVVRGGGVDPGVLVRVGAVPRRAF